MDGEYRANDVKSFELESNNDVKHLELDDENLEPDVKHHELDVEDLEPDGPQKEAPKQKPWRGRRETPP